MADYPMVGFSFRVQWDETEIAFTEVSGLTMETEKIEYRQGSDKEHSKKAMPGLKSYGDITMKRGTFPSENDFYEWFNTINLNKVQRKDLTISLLNEEHEPVVIWKVKNAWPLKVESPDLSADASEVAIESITIAHEGLTIENE